jgi:alcohol dehydrogenase
MDHIGGLQFRHHTRIVFGPGVLATLPEEVRTLGTRKALIVCDPGITRLGMVARVAEALAGGGVDSARFDAISANPRDAECCAAAAAAAEMGADLIIGLGGGSAMDAAKAAAALVTNGGTVKDWEDPRQLEHEPLPLVCIPTTAGTGSEVTFVAVITDEVDHYKMALRGTGLGPRVAIVDPELTLSLPPALTAATGMDALAHAVEAYTCKRANPITDALALRAIALIAGSLRAAVRDGGDIEARSAMLLGSTVAGMAFGNSTVGAVHCVGEALGGLYDTPHGVAVAVFLPAVFRFNIPADPARHADVARAVGVGVDAAAAGAAGGEAAVAELGAAAIERLMADIGLPRLADVPGVDPADFERIAGVSASFSVSQMNPRAITAADYLAILNETYASG